jgi:hypothetical protein
MPSYKKLAVFALAASTVYPALAAPIRYEKPHTGSSGRGLSSLFSSLKGGKIPTPKAPVDPKSQGIGKGIAANFLLSALMSWGLNLVTGPSKSGSGSAASTSAVPASAVPPYSGPTSAVPAGVPAPAMKRTTETSESQPITEMEGRAVGAYKLDKWVKILKDVCLRSLKMRS